MEQKLEEAGVSGTKHRRQIRVTDVDGEEVKLFSGDDGWVPGRQRFPLKVQCQRLNILRSKSIGALGTSSKERPTPRSFVTPRRARTASQGGG